MAQITFPMEIGKRGASSKSSRANGEVQYPSIVVSTDVCGVEDFKSLGLHADFRAKDECTDRIVSDFLTLHYGLRIPISSGELPVTGSGLADIYFDAAELSSAGFTNFGTEWRKLDSTGSFVEYRVNTFERPARDQCGIQFGSLRENNVQRYGYDQATCQIIDLGNMKMSSVLAALGNYADWRDAFVGDTVFDRIGFLGIETDFLALPSSGDVPQFVTDGISAIDALVGSNLVLGRTD